MVRRRPRPAARRPRLRPEAGASGLIPRLGPFRA
jgi:hypothetical protein